MIHVGLCCKVAATGSSQMIRKLLQATKSDEIQSPQEETSNMDLILKRSSDNFQELEKIANTQSDSSLNRKSKILKSLAFLAGLSVGDLAGAASADVKAYTKLPLDIHPGVPRIPPQFAAIYNPYPYVMHPFVLATPFGFYSPLDPLRFAVQNSLIKNPLPSNAFDNAKPTTMTEINDEYVDEAKKVEDIKINEDKERNEKNAEEKAPGTGCILHKGMRNDEDSLKTLNLRAANTTDPVNQTVTNTTVMPNAQNQTSMNNYTYPPFFYGYYDGNPQNVHHIEFTTVAYDHRYHDYEPINYNLPSYNKPVNFYPDERYNYYPFSSADPYVPSHYHQDQIPEYHSNDYKRFFYNSDNAPSFTNTDFRPVA
ncbi:uncharacterized protein LOC108628866 [Ceratina calcarata]|uniref:Uncharacterized protein LOC108628866 n=1 Tax=Ceratina calcarata TaxID=156304 RepID=A0AAJ7S6X0_9HYME|nr:uncharacterized protein LOC108628866 [Ceratina calcarata]